MQESWRKTVLNSPSIQNQPPSFRAPSQSTAQMSASQEPFPVGWSPLKQGSFLVCLCILNRCHKEWHLERIAYFICWTPILLTPSVWLRTIYRASRNLHGLISKRAVKWTEWGGHTLERWCFWYTVRNRTMVATIISPANILPLNKCLNTRDAALKFIFSAFGYQFGIHCTSFCAKYCPSSWPHPHLHSFYQPCPPEENPTVTQDIVFLQPQCRLQH